ncbi:MAG: hypothetical protein AB1489_32305 [Acidobacteriota bacterium]
MKKSTHKLQSYFFVVLIMMIFCVPVVAQVNTQAPDTPVPPTGDDGGSGGSGGSGGCGICFITENLQSNRFDGMAAGTLQVVILYDGATTNTPLLRIHLNNGSSITIGGSNPGGAIDKFTQQIETRQYSIGSLQPTGAFTISGMVGDGVIDGLAFGVFWKDSSGYYHVLKSNSNLSVTGATFVSAWPIGMDTATFNARVPQVTDGFAREQAFMTITGAKLLPNNGTYSVSVY